MANKNIHHAIVNFTNSVVEAEWAPADLRWALEHLGIPHDGYEAVRSAAAQAGPLGYRSSKALRRLYADIRSVLRKRPAGAPSGE